MKGVHRIYQIYFDRQPVPSCWLLLLFLLLPNYSVLFAQEARRPVCEDMMQEGLEHERRGEFSEALQAYLNALNCDSGLAGRIGPRIDTVFQRIQQQKVTANILCYPNRCRPNPRSSSQTEMK